MEIGILIGIIGIIVGFVGIVATVISIIQGIQRKKYKHYFKVIWKKSSKLEPKEILGEFRPYHKYYYKRTEDDRIREAIKNKQNVLITGAPLSGKTRAAYESILNLKKPYDVLMPVCKDIEPDAFRIPKRHIYKRIFSNRQRIVFLDDLHNLVDQKHFDHLIRQVMKLNVPIIATCRSGVEQSKVNDKCSSKGIEMEMIFSDSIVEFEKVSEDVAKQVAEKVEKSWEEVEFDGNIGSVFFPLKAMKDRFEACTNVEKTILKVICTLYHFGVFYGEQVFPIKWIKWLTKEEELEGKEYEWKEWLDGLEKKEFVVIEKDDIRSEEVYLERIVSPLYEETNIGFYNRLIEIFKDVPDALVMIGDKANELGKDKLEITQFMHVAIEAYQGALVHWTRRNQPIRFALTNNALGVSYCRLAEVEDKAQNCHNSLDAYRQAVDICTYERFPVEYAISQSNLGDTYRVLAEVEDKPENCKNAIKACEEALKVFTLDRFPIRHAITQNNLGNGYILLAEVEGKEENCRLAIKAYVEALRIRTFDHFPLDYAMTQNNLGNAYRTLAEVEKKAENSKMAIGAFEEALKVNTFDHFPAQYAATQNNMGIAYRILAEVEEKAENCNLAIGAYEEALKVFTLDRFPMDYAMTQNNLGAAHSRLAEVEEKAENCNLAIGAYGEALKVNTLDRFPIQYATIKINLGATYEILAEEEEKGENCEKAIFALMEALKVFNERDFPEVYPKVMGSLVRTVHFCKDVLPEEIRKMFSDE